MHAYCAASFATLTTVSDCIAVNKSLKPYAVCQCKLVSWHSVNMTNSLVYIIAREREREGERDVVGCKTATPTVSYRFCVFQLYAPEKCVCACMSVQYVCFVHVYHTSAFIHTCSYVHLCEVIDSSCW